MWINMVEPEGTDDSIIPRMRFACLIINATHTRTHTHRIIILLIFHGNNGFAKVPLLLLYKYIACLVSMSYPWRWWKKCQLFWCSMGYFKKECETVRREKKTYKVKPVYRLWLWIALKRREYAYTHQKWDLKPFESQLNWQYIYKFYAFILVAYVRFLLIN